MTNMSQTTENHGKHPYFLQKRVGFGCIVSEMLSWTVVHHWGVDGVVINVQRLRHLLEFHKRITFTNISPTPQW